jgi:hypothetical protein
MGQSSGSGNARGQNIQEEFASLQELLGDWIVDEFVFRTPTAEAIVNIGRTTCRAAIGRLAMVVITDIASTGEQMIQLQTFDPRQNRYELALVNSLSDTGIVLLTGQTVNQRSSEEIRVQFGKQAMAVREWNLVTGQAGGQTGGQTGFEIERIVENKISNDRWVIQFFGRTAQHGEFLIKQQVLSRANVGCQAQVGCDLGCQGLVSCQEGCQGLQGPQGLAGQTQLATCACQSSVTGQAQVITQPVLNPQPLPPGLTQLVLTQPVLTQPVLTQPVIGLVQQVLVAPQGCARLPVRPPEQRVTHPSHPGK